MKKYLKEIIILCVQLIMFYIFPLFMGPNDAILMVLLLILVTFFLGLIMGILSKEKIKYIYPIVAAIVFIPSIFIYYNESALVHSLWYLVISTIGLLLGVIISKFNIKMRNRL